MNVHFTARQTDLTPEVRAYCEKKLKALEKLLGKSPEVDIILSEEKNRRKAEIHAVGKGMDVVVSEETSDMLGSLNLAFDDLEIKIKKDREKFRETRRRKGRVMKEIAPFAEEAGEEVRKILRSSHYSLKPMSVEEAVLLLDAKNREVFMFRKEGTEKWAAVFRRKDGQYGLVEPE